jgi:hypothetical protein
MMKAKLAEGSRALQSCAQPVLQCMCRVKPHEHFMRNLCITRFVGADQAQAIAAQQRRHSIEDEEGAEDHKDRALAGLGPGRQAPVSAFG